MARPRVTASRAVPAPMMPPPTTSTSSSPLGGRRGQRGQRAARGPRAERARLGHVAILASGRRWHYLTGPRTRPLGCARETREELIRTFAGLGLVASLILAVTSVGTLATVEQPRPRNPSGPRAGADRRRAGSAIGRAQPAAEPSRSRGPPASRPEAGRATATVVLSGDLLWHDTVWASAAADHARTGRGGQFDFDPMFAALRPRVEGADLAVCHEEVPFAAPGRRTRTIRCSPRRLRSPAGSGRWAGTCARRRPTTGSTRGTTAWCAPPTSSSGPASATSAPSAPLAERRAAGHLHERAGVRIAVVAGTFGLNGFPLPEPAGRGRSRCGTPTT